jgi:hypothetical protein
MKKYAKSDYKSFRPPDYTSQDLEAMSINQLRELAHIPSLSHATMELLYEYDDFSIQNTLASREDIPLTLQEKLAENEDKTIRWRFAQNTYMAPHLFEKLAQDPDYGVRDAIASNPKVTTEAQDILVNSPHAAIRYRISEKDNISDYALKLLINDNDRYIRIRLSKKHDLPLPLLLQLADKERTRKDKEPNVLKNILYHSRSPKWLKATMRTILKGMKP